MYEEKKKTSNQWKKPANQITPIVLPWKYELAELKWITIAKISFELLNANYSKVRMEIFTNDKAWKLDLGPQKY